MFFQKFPFTLFEVSKTQSSIVTDFIRAVKIDPTLKEDDIFFDMYEAADGETPEIISHKVYGTTQFHWVIMLLNEKFDPWRDFPQPYGVVEKLTKEKYSGTYRLNWTNTVALDDLMISPLLFGMLNAVFDTEPYVTIFSEKFNGRMLGDVNNSGYIQGDLDDVMAFYVEPSIDSTNPHDQYILTTFTNILLSDPVKYAEFLVENDALTTIHHYEDSTGNWVDQFAVDKIPVTNLEYELQENEKKRTVKVLKRAVLDAFVDQYENLIAQ